MAFVRAFQEGEPTGALKGAVCSEDVRTLAELLLGRENGKLPPTVSWGAGGCVGGCSGWVGGKSRGQP